MSSLSEFFTRKGGNAAVAVERAPTAASAAPTLTPGNGPSGDDRPTETWAEIGSRIGGDNEALRNLLVDTGRQVGALDDLKDAFGKLVDPINKTLRALEQEKIRQRQPARYAGRCALQLRSVARPIQRTGPPQRGERNRDRAAASRAGNRAAERARRGVHQDGAQR